MLQGLPKGVLDSALSAALPQASAPLAYREITPTAANATRSNGLFGLNRIFTLLDLRQPSTSSHCMRRQQNCCGQSADATDASCMNIKAVNVEMWQICKSEVAMRHVRMIQSNHVSQISPAGWPYLMSDKHGRAYCCAHGTTDRCTHQQL